MKNLLSESLKSFDVKQNRILVLGLAVAAAFTAFTPAQSKASETASLINSVHTVAKQEFPLLTGVDGFSAKEVQAKKKIAKQKPKYRVTGTMTLSVTTYNSEASQTDSSPNYTADGTWCTWGVAAGPYSLPFGTKIRFKNGPFKGQVFVIHDRMAARSGALDIWMPSKGKAISFGRRTLTIEILAPNR